MHVCVIGAGVVGLTTAYFLQAEGHSVTVIERDAGAASGASRDNGAQLSYSYVAPLADGSVPAKLPSLLFGRDSPLKFHLQFDPAQWKWGWAFLRVANTAAARATTAALLPLAELSREFIEPLIEGEGLECHFKRCGKLVVYGDSPSFAAARAQLDFQSSLGSVQRALSTEECITQEPALEGYRDRIVGGIWTASDAAADCGAFCDQLARLLESAGRGIHLRPKC